MDNQAVITIVAVGVVGVLMPILFIKGVPRIIKLSAIAKHLKRKRMIFYAG